jgi:NAD(P)H-nitrite reductase large subunit
MPRRYVIIGTGVAGLTAAQAIHQKDPTGQLTIVGDDRDGYYSRPGIAYYLDKTIPEQQLFPFSASYIRSLISTRIHARVTQLMPEQHKIVLADGHEISYDRLLLATGSRATSLKFLGSDLQGIVNLYTLEDVRCILKLVKCCRTAVVIGDGIIGIELAEGLAAYGVQVHMFMLENRLWPFVLDDTESRMVERGLKHKGIQLHPQTLMVEAIGRDGVLTAVATKAGETIPCQILGIAIGVFSRMELAQQAGLATERGILVNEYLSTSAEAIFAAGNVAQVRDPWTGKTRLETLWPTARRQGWVAGLNMTGEYTMYTQEPLFNVVRIGDIITATIGAIEPALLTVTSNEPNSWYICRHVQDAIHNDVSSRVRVLIGERSILGAVVMGDQALATPLMHMIQSGTDISPILPELATHPERGIETIARFYKEGIS